VSEYYNCELSGDFRERGRDDCGIQGKLKSVGDNSSTDPDGIEPTTKEGTGQGDSHEKDRQRDASSFKKYRDTDKNYSVSGYVPVFPCDLYNLLK
jgi:hypothetical protein